MRNRVTPEGEIVVTPLRGAWMGNRGSIHRGHEIVRPWATKRWITCALEYKGWTAPKWTPGRWTALFFYDEALSFAAGHRPCALCRRPAYESFRRAIGMTGADPIDAKLHEQRLHGKRKRRHTFPWRDLPDGTYVSRENVVCAVSGEGLLPWDAGKGYLSPVRRPSSGDALVLTPPLAIEAFVNGYRPQMRTTANP